MKIEHFDVAEEIVEEYREIQGEKEHIERVLEHVEEEYKNIDENVDPRLTTMQVAVEKPWDGDRSIVIPVSALVELLKRSIDIYERQMDVLKKEFENL